MKKGSPGVNELKHVKTSSYGSRTATADGRTLPRPAGRGDEEEMKRRCKYATHTTVRHACDQQFKLLSVRSVNAKKKHTTSLSDCRESSCLLHSRWESTGNESLTCLCLFKATNLIL